MQDKTTDSQPKEIMLVLHHTFFHDAFRFYPDFDYVRFKEARFIARFIIERKTELQENQYPAITSNSVFSNFYNSFQKSAKTTGAIKFIKILEDMVWIVKSEPISSLKIDDGITVISDILYSTVSEYEPLVIIRKEAKAKFIENAVAFYRESLKKKFKSVPFRVLGIEEAKLFLEGRYAELCKSVRERMKGEPF